MPIYRVQRIKKLIELTIKYAADCDKGIILPSKMQAELLIAVGNINTESIGKTIDSTKEKDISNSVITKLSSDFSYGLRTRHKNLSMAIKSVEICDNCTEKMRRKDSVLHSPDVFQENTT